MWNGEEDQFSDSGEANLFQDAESGTASEAGTSEDAGAAITEEAEPEGEVTVMTLCGCMQCQADMDPLQKGKGSPWTPEEMDVFDTFYENGLKGIKNPQFG